jgi:hypothetical protein
VSTDKKKLILIDWEKCACLAVANNADETKTLTKEGQENRNKKEFFGMRNCGGEMRH